MPTDGLIFWIGKVNGLIILSVLSFWLERQRHKCFQTFLLWKKLTKWYSCWNSFLWFIEGKEKARKHLRKAEACLQERQQAWKTAGWSCQLACAAVLGDWQQWQPDQVAVVAEDCNPWQPMQVLWWQWSDADEPAGPERKRPKLVALAGLRKEIEGQQGRQEGWNYARQLI